jgi:hypothetical protein
MSSLKFSNYTYPLTNGNINIANEHYNTSLPKSFINCVFHQDPTAKYIFFNNRNLTNTTTRMIDVTGIVLDFSGNFTYTTTAGSTDASGQTVSAISGQTVTLNFRGETFAGTMDSSSAISYYFSSPTTANVSGHYNCVIYDVHHNTGQINLSSSSFVVTGVTTTGSAGSKTIVVNFASLPTGSQNANCTNALSISSYITYNADPSGLA